MSLNIDSQKTEFFPLIGRDVPDISFDIFQNDKISHRTLKEYQGRWLILFFYPADFTFVCPTELESLAEKYDEFKSLNTEVMSVSTDTAFVHKAWHDNSPAIAKVNYPMAADPTGILCKSFGTYIENDGLSYRGTFIIDPDGIVRAYEIHDNNIGRNVDELLRKLQAAQFVRDNKGEVCPAKWTPGKNTLTPGVNLIGKI